MRTNTKIMLLTITLILATRVSATLIQVPGDCERSIQAGIDAAVAEDTVLVADGTYYETGITFRGKAITVMSENGAEATIVDCDDAGRGFVFNRYETPSSVLQGFTIRNGLVDGNGGGIICNYHQEYPYYGHGANPTIRENIIENCTAGGSGGGIYCYCSGPRIVNNVIRNNEAGASGGGIGSLREFQLYGGVGTLWILGNDIINNTALDGGGVSHVRSSGTIDSPRFESNYILNNAAVVQGGGVHFSGTGASMQYNDFQYNGAVLGGGLYCWNTPELSLLGDTFRTNGALDGGAIYCDSLSSISIYSTTGCEIRGNFASGAGGGLYCRYASPDIELYDFVSNHAEGAGGGVFCEFSDAVFTLCNFMQNESQHSDGGGLFADRDSALQLANSYFGFNSAWIDGGGVMSHGALVSTHCNFDDNVARSGHGGGVCFLCPDNAPFPSIQYCDFRENRADVCGGGMAVYGTLAIPVSTCTFTDNEAQFGGGCHTEGENIFLHCEFTGNRAGPDNQTGYGGGVHALVHPLVLYDCELRDNEASFDGGGIYANSAGSDITDCIITGNSALVFGGGMSVAWGDVALSGSTLHDNTAEFGSGIAIDHCWADLQNSIIAFGNIGAAVFAGAPGDGVTGQCSDIFGNDGGPGAAAVLIGVNGNIALDPMFCDAESGDLTLHSNSPCALFSEPNSECGQIGALGIGCAAAARFDPWQQFTGTKLGDAAWADFDGDGDLDLAYCGMTATDTVTITLENIDGTLQEKVQTDLIGVYGSGGNGNLAWGDYDLDGDLDLALCGLSSEGYMTRIYRNDGMGNLSWDEDQVLHGVRGTLAWGDVDNDGDLDLYMHGIDGTEYLARLYVNEPAGTLTEAEGLELVGLHVGAAAWGDYDGDGDLDLVCTGSDGVNGNRRIVFYENDPVGTLVNTGSNGLPGAVRSDVAWGDYDNDGDLDLVRSGGQDVGVARTYVYANDGAGNFTEIADLCDVHRSSCAWGDYDNDGDLDLAVVGETLAGECSTHLFRNMDGEFLEAKSWEDQLSDGSVSWADVDLDGDLDLFVLGKAEDGSYHAALYRNVPGVENEPPSPPAELVTGWVEEAGGEWSFHVSWSGAADTETPDQGLYYCLRVGTSPGADDICSGTYGSPLMGNVQQMAELTMHLPLVRLYTSVRTIDAGLLASGWADEQIISSTDSDQAPVGFVLSANVPNPFNPRTRIAYVIPAGAGTLPVNLRIFDVSGRLVRTLVDEAQAPGRYEIFWDGTDQRGAGAASGVYLYRLSWNGRQPTRQMVLVR